MTVKSLLELLNIILPDLTLQAKVIQFFVSCEKCKLEDLKVLRRSPDLLNNVKIGQGQLQLIMEQILFYHIWGLQSDE